MLFLKIIFQINTQIKMSEHKKALLLVLVRNNEQKNKMYPKMLAYQLLIK